MVPEYAKDWSGELPQAGHYRINVLPDTAAQLLPEIPDVS